MMEGVFSLNYSEYDVINKLSFLLRKSDGYGVYIPISRQQKGVDFIILNNNNGKVIRVQVKGSRSYYIPDYHKKYTHLFGLWFGNFLEKYKEGNADLYVLYGLYPHLKE